MDFIINNLEAVIGVLVALVLIAYAVINKQWSMLQVGAYRLMLSAERLMKTAEGKKKMEEVFKAVWMKIPKWLKRFVTEKTLREKLQQWYDLAKDDLHKEVSKESEINAD